MPIPLFYPVLYMKRQYSPKCHYELKKGAYLLPTINIQPEIDTQNKQCSLKSSQYIIAQYSIGEKLM